MKIIVKDNKDKEYKIYVESKNSKLGNIANFSVKKGINAYCNKNCNKCYCNYMKMYNSHVEHVSSNFNAIDDSKNDDILKDNIIQAISYYIMLNGCDVFRFNVEGDINNNYLDIIIQIAKKNSNCIIYLYTKNYNIIEQHLNNIVNVNNLIILLSIMDFNDSHIIDKYRKYNNIKFFITTRNEKERLLYYKTYRFDYFKTCKNDNNKQITCKGCKLCFNNESQFIFNKYRGIKKVKKDTIPYVDIFLKTSNRFEKNAFLNSALREALTVIFCNTTTKKEELSNLNKLIDIKIRSFSKNSKKQYGQCQRFNNDYYKITINNMNYYKTVCVLIHELLHVLAFDDSHAGKFEKYAREIEENTIFKCRGAKLKLNDINYKNSIELENKLIELTRHDTITYCLDSSYTYFNDKTKKQLVMELSNNIVHSAAKMASFECYTNLRSIVTKTVKDTLKVEYSRILRNIND